MFFLFIKILSNTHTHTRTRTQHARRSRTTLEPYNYASSPKVMGWHSSVLRLTSTIVPV
jgi:hypothetical protein